MKYICLLILLSCLFSLCFTLDEETKEVPPTIYSRKGHQGHHNLQQASLSGAEDLVSSENLDKAGASFINLVDNRLSDIAEWVSPIYLIFLIFSYGGFDILNFVVTGVIISFTLSKLNPNVKSFSHKVRIFNGIRTAILIVGIGHVLKHLAFELREDEEDAKKIALYKLAPYLLASAGVLFVVGVLKLAIIIPHPIVVTLAALVHGVFVFNEHQAMVKLASKKPTA
jgi:hypothetical protein